MDQNPFRLPENHSPRDLQRATLANEIYAAFTRTAPFDHRCALQIADRALEAIEAIPTPNKRVKELEAGIDALLTRYLELATSGDCGFWDPEDEQVVINTRALLSKTEGK